MTYAALDSYEYDRFERGLPRRRRPLPIARVATVVGLACLLGTTLFETRRTAVPETDQTQGMPRASAPAAVSLVPRPIGHRASMIVAAVTDPALLDSNFPVGVAPRPLSLNHPLDSRFVFAAPPTRVAVAELPSTVEAMPVPRPADDIPLPPETSPLVENEAVPLPPEAPTEASVPLPMPRPAFAPPPPPSFVPAPARHRLALAPQPQAPATPAPAQDGNFLQKFFGMLKPSAPALGYAAPEDGLFGRLRGATFNPSRNYDRWTAVYDISAHTVYLPDGTRLEAHSGLGTLLDDPRSVQERNRGATPPQMYDLQPREALFHGVEALRLNPVGGGGVYGRVGLLAHTFMLGPNGDSNGCVSFRDYRAFLQAYKAGQVRRLAVVTRL